MIVYHSRINSPLALAGGFVLVGRAMKIYKRSLAVAALSLVILPGLVAQEPDKAVMDLKLKILELQNAGQTGYKNLNICDVINGYGLYTKNEGNQVKQDTAIQIYYEPKNLFTVYKDGIYSMSYTQDLILLNADESKEIFRQNEMLKFNNSSMLPVLDVFATNKLNLEGLPPGDYVIKGVMRDKLRQNAQDVEWKLKFSVVE